MGGTLTRMMGSSGVAPVARNIVDVLGVTVNNAYSLRKVRSAYAGSAIRVRRSSDNTEQDIGFDGSGDLDTASLLSFTGAGDGFIRTFYEQAASGGTDLIQSVTANQAQIVSSGAVLTISTGRPTMQFDGVTDFMAPFAGGTQTIAQPFTRCGVFKFLSIASGQNIYSDAASNSLYFSASGSIASYAGATAVIKTGISANDKASVIERLGGSSAYYNGTGGSYSPSTLSSARRGLGAAWSGTAASAWANVACSEHIIWASTLSDPNLVALYTNQMAYWGLP